MFSRVTFRSARYMSVLSDLSWSFRAVVFVKLEAALVGGEIGACHESANNASNLCQQLILY
ncbi:hypothetical protein M3J09_007220 [Ascochyta lentis]